MRNTNSLNLLIDKEDNTESGQNVDDWAIRSAYWNNKSQLDIPKRKRREKAKTGLVLTGVGLSISVDKGRLVLKDGNTHYPSKPITYTYFKGALDIPPRIVLVDGKGSITLDALDWMAEQKVDLIRLRYDGRFQSVSSASGYSADPEKVAWQRKTGASEKCRVEYAIKQITSKIKETQFNLENMLPDSPSRAKAIERCKTSLKELKITPPETVSQLLAVEGLVAQGYFFAWRALKLSWKAECNYPIQDDWKRFFSRSSLIILKGSPSNRRATHPINAMLNYAYGILESQVRIQTIADGYDPKIGLFHQTTKSDRYSFVYDQMEPLRPIVDREILRIVNEETFSGADFELQSDGVCRLNPELARTIVQRISA